ncbi:MULTISPECIES: isopentenyl-diphosphate delta-isomerase [unclassified Azospirillum]|uniref:isopentenyl-diphosphate delta-isomerase n=1 Tax=unclassified Azospirillum TaxID=2630922 RepID=UPI000B716AF1|nr:MULTISPECIES: isopentenyl-diphosphate delta-isomerase [unclassified Azospirillum]SNT02375.1 isopentenyl-diphosphate delta-isomerase [Azospirillum sp. RU38E]SNT18054.1 isopentenyl-diphosphate delta-isomerase [Azospirillum sp. RU37A]
MDMIEKPIIIPAVAPDGSLFPIEKMAAHVTGQLHLAVSVFVFDGDLLLLQRRALGKYHCAGLWANSCCTHPHWRETVEACAARRLREELGISLPLQRHQTVDYAADVGEGLREHERVTLFSASADHARLVPSPDPAEVAATRWISLTELRREVASQPESFTPWLRIYLQRFPDLSFDRPAQVA